MSQGPPVAIRTVDLEVAYGQIRAVHGVSLDVSRGGVTALVGANGAGKSSLLKGIAGLVPVRRGRIEIPVGVDITRMAAHRRVRELGLVLVPEGRGVFGAMTVDDNLALGSRVGSLRRGDGGKESSRASEEVLELFPVLRERRRLEARYLSGGEQQMLSLGRALLMEPSVLLVDEPSAGLAPLVVKDIFATLRDVLIKKEITVLLVEQDTNVALSIADWACIIQRGRIEDAGPASEIAQNPRLRAAYLGGSNSA